MSANDTVFKLTNLLRICVWKTNLPLSQTNFKQFPTMIYCAIVSFNTILSHFWWLWSVIIIIHSLRPYVHRSHTHWSVLIYIFNYLVNYDHRSGIVWKVPSIPFVNKLSCNHYGKSLKYIMERKRKISWKKLYSFAFP